MYPKFPVLAEIPAISFGFLFWYEPSDGTNFAKKKFIIIPSIAGVQSSYNKVWPIGCHGVQSFLESSY
jgi:hypothetical protein